MSITMGEEGDNNNNNNNNINNNNNNTGQEAVDHLLHSSWEAARVKKGKRPRSTIDMLGLFFFNPHHLFLAIALLL